MRSNWNAELRERIQRIDPNPRVVAQLGGRSQAVASSTFGDWALADLYYVEVLTTGGVRLVSFTTAAHAVQDVTDGSITVPLPPSPPQPVGFPPLPFYVAEVEWNAVTPAGIIINTLEAYLDAQLNVNNPQEVVTWRAQLWRVAEIDDQFALDSIVELQPISSRVTRTPGGPSAELIRFTFPDASVGPPGTNLTNAWTVIVIEALNAQGGPAGNCGWVGDSSSGGSKGINDGHVARAVRYTGSADPYLDTTFDRVENATSVPRFSLLFDEYNVGTAEFTGPNRLELAEALTCDSVVLLAEGNAPGDSSIRWYIREPGDIDWVEFRDGDRVGENNAARGGFDLSSLAVRNDYEFRVELYYGEVSGTLPVARRIGMSEYCVLELGFDDLALQIDQVRWAIDPYSLRGEIGEIVLRLFRTGEVDYLDPVTDFLSTYHLRDVIFELYLGAPDLDRADWMLIDVWELEDYDFAGGADVSLIGVSPTARTRTLLPRFDHATETRVPIEFTNTTLTQAWSELLLDHLQVPERYFPMLPADPLLITSAPVGGPVSKIIEDGADGKDELDGIAWLDGGGMITSQGQIVFRQIIRDLSLEDPVEDWRGEETRVLQIGPGKRSRVVEYSVPWNWDYGQDRFLNEIVGVNETALLVDDKAWLDAQERLDQSISMWIITEFLAETVATREVLMRGGGVATARIQLPYMHPHLEVGDFIRFRTDRYVTRTIDGDVLKGWLAIDAVIVEQADIWGREFLVWMLDYVPFEIEIPAPPGGGNGDPVILPYRLIITSDAHSCTPGDAWQQYVRLEEPEVDPEAPPPDPEVPEVCWDPIGSTNSESSDPAVHGDWGAPVNPEFETQKNMTNIAHDPRTGILMITQGTNAQYNEIHPWSDPLVSTSGDCGETWVPRARYSTFLTYYGQDIIRGQWSLLYEIIPGRFPNSWYAFNAVFGYYYTTDNGATWSAKQYAVVEANAFAEYVAFGGADNRFSPVTFYMQQNTIGILWYDYTESPVFGTGAVGIHRGVIQSDGSVEWVESLPPNSSPTGTGWGEWGYPMLHGGNGIWIAATDVYGMESDPFSIATLPMRINYSPQMDPEAWGAPFYPIDEDFMWDVFQGAGPWAWEFWNVQGHGRLLFLQDPAHPCGGRWWLMGMPYTLLHSDDNGQTWSNSLADHNAAEAAMHPILNWRKTYSEDGRGNPSRVLNMIQSPDDPQCIMSIGITYDRTGITNRLAVYSMSDDGGNTWGEVKQIPLEYAATGAPGGGWGVDSTAVARHIFMCGTNPPGAESTAECGPSALLPADLAHDHEMERAFNTALLPLPRMALHTGGVAHYLVDDGATITWERPYYLLTTNGHLRSYVLGGTETFVDTGTSLGGVVVAGHPGGYIANAGSGGSPSFPARIRIYAPGNITHEPTLPFAEVGQTRALAWGPDRFSLYHGGSTGTLRRYAYVWEEPFGAPIFSVTGYGTPSCVAVDKDGNSAWGTESGNVVVLGPTGTLLWSEAAHTGVVKGIAFDETGAVYSASVDGLLKKLAAANGALLWTHDELHELTSCAIDETYAYTTNGSNLELIRVLRSTGAEDTRFTVGRVQNNGMRVDEEGRVLVAIDNGTTATRRVRLFSSTGTQLWDNGVSGVLPQDCEAAPGRIGTFPTYWGLTP